MTVWESHWSSIRSRSLEFGRLLDFHEIVGLSGPPYLWKCNCLFRLWNDCISGWIRRGMAVTAWALTPVGSYLSELPGSPFRSHVGTVFWSRIYGCWVWILDLGKTLKSSTGGWALCSPGGTLAVSSPCSSNSGSLTFGSRRFRTRSKTWGELAREELASQSASEWAKLLETASSAIAWPCCADGHWCICRTCTFSYSDHRLPPLGTLRWRKSSSRHVISAKISPPSGGSCPRCSTAWKPGQKLHRWLWRILARPPNSRICLTASQNFLRWANPGHRTTDSCLSFGL